MKKVLFRICAIEPVVKLTPFLEFMDFDHVEKVHVILVVYDWQVSHLVLLVRSSVLYHHFHEVTLDTVSQTQEVTVLVLFIFLKNIFNNDLTFLRLFFVES